MKLPDFVHGMQAKTILDVGGWFKPEPMATHVIDLMPWETRRAKLCLEQQPGEKFSKETWYQADFLDPGFRMPFEDNYFDLVLCGHTVEDLRDPRPVLAEMSRVGKAGLIECPSRLSEQTIGVADRMNRTVGYRHHHWIVDVVADQLLLCSKQASNLSPVSALPYLAYESICGSGRGQNVQYYWEEVIDFRIEESVDLCAQLANDFVARLDFNEWLRPVDALIRLVRRLKYSGSIDPVQWDVIFEESRRYSSISI